MKLKDNESIQELREQELSALEARIQPVPMDTEREIDNECHGGQND